MMSPVVSDPALESTPDVPATTQITELPPAVKADPALEGPADVEKTVNGTNHETTSVAASNTTPAAPVTNGVAAAPIKEEKVGKKDVAVEATLASEGSLGYKAPGLMNFRFAKRHFWFSDEPIAHEHLSTYLQSEKSDVVHPTGAWAKETGKGLLFFAKRAEDKPEPQGILHLADATDVAEEGEEKFSFKIGAHRHQFEAENTAERATWITALKTKISEASTMKKNVTESAGYKKHLEAFAAPAAVGAAATGVAGASTRNTSAPPKKSIDQKVKDAIKPSRSSLSSDDEAKKAQKTEQEAAKEQKKEEKSRSKSRSRSGIFGSLMGKKEEHDDEKEVKKEIKAEEKAEKKYEKKHEKEVSKEEKKHEKAIVKEHKKEEDVKATHDSHKGAEAAAAATVAAVPAAAIATDKKTEEKTDASATTPVTKEHKKRGSIFGSLFPKKDLTSPTAEKTEAEVAPAVPAKDNTKPVVAETAPKIEEPIINKPIDTAAVTAPVDNVIPPTATPAIETTAKEETITPATKSTSAPNKGGFLGFIKNKTTKKEEKKEEKAAEAIASDPVAAAAPAAETSSTPMHNAATVDPTAAAATTTPATKPALKDKRRSSLFDTLKTGRKAEPPTTDSEVSDGEAAKSPTEKESGIKKLGRRLSTAIRRDPKRDITPGGTERTPFPEGTETKPETISKEESAAVNGTNAQTVTDSRTIGDVVPGAAIANNTTPEVKASA